MARVAFSNLIRSQSTHLISRHPSLGYNSFKLQAPTIIPSAELHSCSFLAIVHRRWESSYPKPQYDTKITVGPPQVPEIDENDKEAGIAYHGPISSTIRKVKLLSLSLSNLLFIGVNGSRGNFLDVPRFESDCERWCGRLCHVLSATTTAALHWFVSPYIHKIKWQPGSNSLEAEMMSWLATPLTKTIKFSDIRIAETNRPYVTFMANGNFYFVDPNHCPNKALLAKLAPQKPTHES